MPADIAKPTPTQPPPLKGWLIRYRNGATAFVYSDPIHWPLSIIRNVACLTHMPKPSEGPCQCINCTDGDAA